jgi:hypothetical protein
MFWGEHSASTISINLYSDDAGSISSKLLVPTYGPHSHNPDNHNMNHYHCENLKICTLYTTDTKCHKNPGSNYDENTGRWVDILHSTEHLQKFIQNYVMWTFVASTVWCPAACIIYGTLFTDWHGAHYIYYSSTICIVTGTKKKAKLQKDEIHACHYCTVCHMITNLRLSPSHTMTQAVTSLGQWGPEFNPSPVWVGLFMDKVALDFPHSISFLLWVSFHQCSTLIHLPPKQYTFSKWKQH